MASKKSKSISLIHDELSNIKTIGQMIESLSKQNVERRMNMIIKKAHEDTETHFLSLLYLYSNEGTKNFQMSDPEKEFFISEEDAHEIYTKNITRDCNYHELTDLVEKKAIIVWAQLHQLPQSTQSILMQLLQWPQSTQSIFSTGKRSSENLLNIIHTLAIERGLGPRIIKDTEGKLCIRDDEDPTKKAMGQENDNQNSLIFINNEKNKNNRIQSLERLDRCEKCLGDKKLKNIKL